MTGNRYPKHLGYPVDWQIEGLVCGCPLGKDNCNHAWRVQCRNCTCCKDKCFKGESIGVPHATDFSIG